MRSNDSNTSSSDVDAANMQNDTSNNTLGLRKRRSRVNSAQDSDSTSQDDNSNVGDDLAELENKAANSSPSLIHSILNMFTFADKKNKPNNSNTTLKTGPTALTQEQIVAREKKISRIMIRVSLGALMLCFFYALIYLGHLYICAFVILVEISVFKELVRVRYSTYFETIEDQIPLFRTTQWAWFVVATFYTYGDFIIDILQSNPRLHYLLPVAQYLGTVSFVLYSGTFVLTIATFQRDQIRFQINQLCYTILVLCLTIGQLKYIMHNVFNGLIWFVLPCCLVFTNDIMAYVCGMIYGRKFIQRPFIRFSPNKTWEGFIGGWICTVIVAWNLAAVLAQYTWMTCPTNEFRLKPQPLTCDIDPIFLQAQAYIPSQVFELFPLNLVKTLPYVVQVCAIKGTNTTQLTPCVSGEKSHVHHHFELTLRNYYPIQVHAVWLAMFASLVAPFGGFFASAIKRAYGVKDFDSIIPGHGGVMDRMDCQFLMALCTWVHYNTFVKLATISVPRLAYMYSLLTEQEKREFLDVISVSGMKRKHLADFGLN